MLSTLHRFKLVILAVTFSFFSAALLGNKLTLNFNKISTKDGLTEDRYNNFVFEDSRGFVWISSIGGLFRYDGLNVKTYRFESGLKTDNIQSDFFEDKMGDIWFTTYDAINCYSAESDSIYNYKIEQESTGYQVFYLDTFTNYLWLRTGNNIYKWNIHNNTDCELIREGISSRKIRVQTDSFGRLEKIAILEKKNNLILIDIQNSSAMNIFEIPPSYDFIHLENTKWLLYNKSKVFTFDEETPFEITSTEINANVKIFDLIKYKDDLVFLSTQDNGLRLYNLRKNELEPQLKKNENNVFSLSSNSPKYLYLSPSGYLWVNHLNIGIDYTSVYKSKFYNPLSRITDKNIEITSIVESKDGMIWISSRKNGIFVFEDEEFIYQFKYPFKNNDQTELWQIIEHDELGVVGLTSKYIYKFDLKSHVISNLIPRSDTLTFRFIYKIFPDRYLISSNLGIIELVNKENDKVSLKFCDELAEYQEFSFVQMFQSQNNRVFIPYSANELWFYLANRNELKLESKNDSCNLQFYGFCESEKQVDIVWAGTSNGLKLINEKNEIKSVFKDNSELANGNVYGIVEDKKGILWLTTNRGLWKYNPNKPNEKPIHFEEADGLSGELFSLYHSAILASDGSIWLGNNKGLVKFHPDSIKVHKEIPKLHLDELLVNDTRSFRKKIEDNTLVLKHNQNTLTFDIKAVNLYKTKRNKIYYQLTGYDEEEDTLQINNGEKIRYTKIKPGNYKLYAYAEDANGHKSKMKKLLDLKINPPWWLTKPSLILYALLSAFITYALLKRRENYIIEEQNKKAAVEQLKAQVKLEEEARKREVEQLEASALLKQQAQKTEIAELETQVLEVQMTALRVQMNPHFLFNSLNSIKSLILKTQEKEASTYLSKFSTLLRSILNNSEKPKIKLGEEIEALQLYVDLESLRFASNFNYQLQIDKTIDSSFIRIPPLLLQPFVENAIWHGLLPKTSGNPKLNINIIRNEDFLFFEIEDNGVGREKTTALPKKENRKSMGINITKKRIQLLHPENDIEIIDLVDHHQQALGTKVVIQLFAPE